MASGCTAIEPSGGQDRPGSFSRFHKLAVMPSEAMSSCGRVPANPFSRVFGGWKAPCQPGLVLPKSAALGSRKRCRKAKSSGPQCKQCNGHGPLHQRKQAGAPSMYLLKEVLLHQRRCPVGTGADVPRARAKLWSIRGLLVRGSGFIFRRHPTPPGTTRACCEHFSMS